MKKLKIGKKKTLFRVFAVYRFMKAIDMKAIYRGYRGKWVALKDDEQTVVASGKTLKEVMLESQKKGINHPMVMQIPKEVLPIVGII